MSAFNNIIAEIQYEASLIHFRLLNADVIVSGDASTPSLGVMLLECKKIFASRFFSDTKHK